MLWTSESPAYNVFAALALVAGAECCRPLTPHENPSGERLVPLARMYGRSRVSKPLHSAAPAPMTAASLAQPDPNSLQLCHATVERQLQERQAETVCLRPQNRTTASATAILP